MTYIFVSFNSTYLFHFIYFLQALSGKAFNTMAIVCHTTFYVSICSNEQFFSINVHCPIVCKAFVTSVLVVARCTEGVKAVYEGIENYIGM